MPYTRPGVYVTESPLKSTVRRSAGTSTAAFVGKLSRGSMNPTLIDSWSGFTSKYGELSQTNDVAYAVYQFFANGGRNCYVSRVAYADAAAATAGSVMYFTPSTGSASARLFGATAIDPGVFGNRLGIVNSAGVVSATSSVLPTFNLSVRVDGVEVEFWTELSPDPDNNRYAPTIVNTYSAYVNLNNFASVNAHAQFVYSNTGASVSLAGGSDGTAAVSAPADWDAPFQTAFTKLRDVPEPLLINAVGQSRTEIVHGALQLAADRGDSFVIIDPSPSPTTAGGVTTVTNAYTTNTNYGAVYYPMLKMTDPAKTGIGAIRNTYPGGAVAGLYARMEYERTVAKAPAGYGFEIRNALGLVNTFTETEVGTLYTAGVNTFKAVPGAGVIVQGARTLKLDRPDKYVTVRRSLNYVKFGVSEIAKTALFEPNDNRLWNSLTMRINKYLSDFWGAGGLKGRTPDEAFFVVCDSTNNTNTTIDDGVVNISVGVSLLYPAEFIVINISQWLGGDAANSI